MKDLFSLTKPRIVMMVLITFCVGFVLGSENVMAALLPLIGGLVGTALSAAGAGALNNYIERDYDKLMKRTMNRPLPAGRVSPRHALQLGLGCSAVGCIVLLGTVNPLTSLLSLLSVILYAAVYTPLKRVSWLSTPVGAVPGALPVLGGWTAATGSIDPLGIALFMLLFIWQHPHFYALAWLYREDYRRGGFRLLPIVDASGRSTFRQIVVFSLLMLPVSVLPALMGASGLVYYYGSLLLGSYLVALSVVLALSHHMADARRLFRATLLYFPCLFVFVAVDSGLERWL